MAKPKYKIPFIKNPDEPGYSMMEYTTADEGEIRSPTGVYWLHPDEWRDNTPFTAVVELLSHGRGRSSVRVFVRNVTTGDKYSMGIAALFEAVKHFGVRKGTIKGEWEFRKQGANYTLWPVHS